MNSKVPIFEILNFISATYMTKQKVKKISKAKVLSLGLFLLIPFFLLAQENLKDSLLPEVTLKNAVDYAIIHQPMIRQSLVDEAILETTIKSKLADWYPQINFNYNLQHNFIRQSSLIGGTVIKLGADNTSLGAFTVSQNIFNKDVALANRTKGTVRLQARQVTSSNKIDIAANVSKAFYDVLATLEQIKVSQTNITRIEHSLKDAYAQYTAGIADKIDYKRATITLNNAKATLYSNDEMLKAKQAYLKSLMGYPISGQLNIVYDSLQMEKETIMDTMQAANYNARIEYQLLTTQKKLLEYSVKYNKWSYLPTVALNGAYNLNYFNNAFSRIYSNMFPNSFAALTLAFPIFQGGKRKANIRGAELEVERNALDIVNFQNNLNAEFTHAMSSYKSNYQNYLALKDNLAVAREVYNIIELQYRSGIKAYLEVITAESDLRTSEINYYSAMYQVLASKIDIQKALGQITY